MSNFVLKLIAIIAMLIDHIGAIFLSPALQPELYILFRGIGRLAFPIFVFLIVEGFHHTKDVRKYLIRLGIFAFISEIPFDLAFYRVMNGFDVIEDMKAIYENGFQMKQLEHLLNNFNGHQNIFFTLFLGLLLIYLMKLVELKFQKEIIISNLIDAALTLIFCVLAFILKVDYGFAGILLFVSCYLFRGSKILISIALFIICGYMSNFEAYLQTRNILYIIQMLAMFAMVPIALYNGKKGKNVKYIFYIFYPAHLLLLFLIAQFIS